MTQILNKTFKITDINAVTASKLSMDHKYHLQKFSSQCFQCIIQNDVVLNLLKFMENLCNMIHDNHLNNNDSLPRYVNKHEQEMKKIFVLLKSYKDKLFVTGLLLQSWYYLHVLGYGN